MGSRLSAERSAATKTGVSHAEWQLRRERGERWCYYCRSWKPMEVVVELANLPAKHPRGWERKAENLRVFGFADRHGPLAGWRTACRKAGIEYLPPHSAGRHGFGQEMNVRQDVDEKAAGAFGGWRDTALMKRTYTHAEDADSKIHSAFRTGLAQNPHSDLGWFRVGVFFSTVRRLI